MAESTVLQNPHQYDELKSQYASSYVIHKLLGQTYTIWCHNQNSGKWYNISSFKTMSQYWACMKAMLDRPRMVSNGMLFIMKGDVNPNWSNDDNIKGGRISWKLTKPEASECWENICSLFVSGEFDKIFGAYDCRGVSISPKKDSNIIKLWVNSLIPEDVMSSAVLPDYCIFKSSMMIFRSNEDALAISNSKKNATGYKPRSRNTLNSQYNTGNDNKSIPNNTKINDRIERPIVGRKWAPRTSSSPVESVSTYETSVELETT